MVSYEGQIAADSSVGAFAVAEHHVAVVRRDAQHVRGYPDHGGNAVSSVHQRTATANRTRRSASIARIVKTIKITINSPVAVANGIARRDRLYADQVVLRAFR